MRVLIVDDEVGILETLRILFKGEGFEVVTAGNVAEGVAVLESELPDLVLSDIRMPGATGLELLSRANELDPSLPVILMTAQASLQSAVRAVNEGAYYYLQKPFANDELLAICRRALETRELKKENTKLKKEINRREQKLEGRPTGRSRAFVEILKLAETVAPTDSTILISGESGSGKEVLARYIHNLSDRAEGPFVSINCGALPENLLESELFGHVKGSFTGAVKDKDGLFVAAEGGTFFLDEVGEMSASTQVKLLRALQEREVIPVGSTQPISVDARIVAATNRDLEEEIRLGRFRTDLFYRLNVIALMVPPLRARPEDIPLLADLFLARLGKDGVEPAQVAEETLELLLKYEWPGNVRELENALERAAVLGGGSDAVLLPEALPQRIREALPPQLVEDRLPPNPTMEVIERAYILWVLQAEGGNKSRAAEVLGIDPSTLYRKLSRYGIEA